MATLIVVLMLNIVQDIAIVPHDRFIYLILYQTTKYTF